MKCMDCPLKHIGQRGRTFYTRHKEHIQAIWTDNGNAGYSKHILNTEHTHGRIIETVKVVKKGKHLNTLEKYHTHTHTHIYIYNE
jgi:hypothetical protein